MLELEKQMQPALQTDAVTEFFNRKQLPGEDFRDFYTNLWILARNAFVEKDVFWRVNVSNPKTCSEAYGLMVQTYIRLQILNNNQKISSPRKRRETRKVVTKRSISMLDGNAKSTSRLLNYVSSSENMVIWDRTVS
ncbi:hypothetical protein BpHYR1_001155 [Brachionus plicatilis]|uniref:Uncharacterized protein n=1 Tax=Brachionus plicatilis TaxID=10195 RepID=A0A3M7RKU9_BRAPC|nr:hypothetical protein BpHYR1_001155 [Brachionus plicatilis]